DVPSEPEERIGGNAARPNARGNKTRCVIGRDVRHKFVVPVVSAKCVQQAANVNLIAGEVASDRVSVNGKPHGRYQYSRPKRPIGVLKKQIPRRVSACKLLFRQGSAATQAGCSRSLMHARSRERA